MVSKINSIRKDFVLTFYCLGIDDIISFRLNIEQLFKSLSRVRGRKQDCAELSRHLEEKLQESFPELTDEVEPPPKKKAKNEPTEEHLGKRLKIIGPKATSDDLNTKNKGLIRDIVSKLSKNPLCEAFLYPVDRR